MAYDKDDDDKDDDDNNHNHNNNNSDENDEGNNDNNHNHNHNKIYDNSFKDDNIRKLNNQTKTRFLWTVVKEDGTGDTYGNN
jgi:hypothetical protein